MFKNINVPLHNNNMNTKENNNLLISKDDQDQLRNILSPLPIEKNTFTNKDTKIPRIDNPEQGQEKMILSEPNKNFDDFYISEQDFCSDDSVKDPNYDNINVNNYSSTDSHYSASPRQQRKKRFTKTRSKLLKTTNISDFKPMHSKLNKGVPDDSRIIELRLIEEEVANNTITEQYTTLGYRLQSVPTETKVLQSQTSYASGENQDSMIIHNDQVLPLQEAISEITELLIHTPDPKNSTATKNDSNSSSSSSSSSSDSSSTSSDSDTSFDPDTENYHITDKPVMENSTSLHLLTNTAVSSSDVKNVNSVNINENAISDGGISTFELSICNIQDTIGNSLQEVAHNDNNQEDITDIKVKQR